MILTKEEYARGFLDFDASIPEGGAVNIWTRTSDGPHDPGIWTGPYSNPDGNKVQSPSKQYMQIRINLERGPNPRVSPVLTKARWDRNGLTYIFPGKDGWLGEPRKLILGRDYGCSYRIVFRPRKSTWKEPFVLMDGTTRIRFWNEPITGHLVSGFDAADFDAMGNPILEGGVEEITSEGPVIEVLATVPTMNEEEGKERAKAQVEAIAGLLGLWGGEQVLGETVFEDYYFSSPTDPEQGEVPIGVSALEPFEIHQDKLGVAETALEELRSSPISGSVKLALRWFGKALTTSSPVDAFISHFVGLEALVDGYFDSIDPSPVREQTKLLREYFEAASPKIDQSLKWFVIERVADFPLSAKFDTYLQARSGRNEAESREFRGLNRLRGEILHGKLQTISLQQVRQVRRLLEECLAKELHLEFYVETRHRSPTVLQALLRYALVSKAAEQGP
jgi:hypothetical protein